MSARPIARRAVILSGWLVTIAAALVIAAFVTLMVGPRLLGWQGVIVLSGSMEPSLETGSLALVQPVDVNEIKVGNVITHRPPQRRSQLVTHRVIEVITGGPILLFRTQGDANADPDAELIAAPNVVGRVQYGIPYVGHIVDAMRDRSTYYAVVGIPTLVLVLSELYTVAREYNRNRRRDSAGDLPEDQAVVDGGPA